ncbi:hypothetical protein [Streptomyces sp. NPDC059008]|uniref:hypothetical protein n=1 Tax=Streptomyces sp. NPDC059008 TaxID=3346693 RepID=UPI00367E8357
MTAVDHLYASRMAQATVAVEDFVRLTRPLAERRSAELDLGRLDGVVLPRLLAAYDWLTARADKDERAARLCITLAHGEPLVVWTQRQSAERRLDLLTAARKSAYRFGYADMIPVLDGALADAHLDREDYVRAVSHYEVSLTASERDSRARAQNFAGLGLAYAMIGHESDARPLLARALDLCREAADEPGQIATLLYLCRAHLHWGEDEAAVAGLESCTATASLGVPNGPGILAALRALCRVGQGGQAMDIAHARVDANQIRGYDREAAQRLLQRAAVHYELGDARAARADLDEARRLAESTGASAVLHDVLALLGLVLSSLEEHKVALRVLGTRLQMAAAWGARRRWQALTDLAQAARAAGDDALCIEYHQQALSLAESDQHQVITLGEQRFESHPMLAGAGPVGLSYQLRDDYALRQSKAALAELAVRAREGEERDAAWAELDAAVDSALEGGFFGGSRSGRQHEQLLNLAGLAAFDLGAYDRALAYQGRRADSLRERQDRKRLAHALGECADARRMKGEPAPALKLYEEVAALDREIGDHTDEVHATANMAGCAGALGDRDRALHLLRRAADLAACHDYRAGRLKCLVDFRALARPDAPLDEMREIFSALASAEALAVELEDPEAQRHAAAWLAQIPAELASVARGESLYHNDKGALAGEERWPEALEMLRQAVHWSALCPDDPFPRAVALGNRGRVALDHDAVVAAVSFADAAAHAALHEDRDLQVEALRWLGVVLGRDIGDLRAAIAVLRRLRDRHPPVDTNGLRALVELCGFELQAGTVADSILAARLDEALDAARAADRPLEEAIVLSYQGKLEERRGRHDAAAAAFARAVHLGERHQLTDLAHFREELARTARLASWS